VAVSVTAFAQTPSLISLDAQKRIIDAPGVPVFGATSPEVVVVEYFDFNCPFCRKLAPSFRSLLKSDPKVAVVYKDWPIFGGVSEYAARCALAAQWQGQYGEAHEALIAAPRLSQNGQVDEALQRAGIDMSQIHSYQYAAPSRRADDYKDCGSYRSYRPGARSNGARETPSRAIPDVERSMDQGD
jgi:protein-disulfide isomerase